ncbi:hypothetical protein TRFO_40026 [Tritrichomonas foetus]|uniref:Uncharacterized protein n=1 Tax=Tritrichomonas foetus TaxID=1144522 RepID=A0A1J4J2N8_9EUKA|nr:hypothetical protein TRFO_40026 [Tritrichomonas foetus]|eukprot:OHS93704.1 hypothetical protein TRFO_40026 [Tritrichomonas foetus]
MSDSKNTESLPNEQNSQTQVPTITEESLKSIISKYAQADNLINSELGYLTKNPRTDITSKFFSLVDVFSDLFDISPLPRNQNRLFFASFLVLHHYAVDLYQPGVSHSDVDFSAQWRVFSAIFKTYQMTFLPIDYSNAIESLKLAINPFQPAMNQNSGNNRIMSTLNNFFQTISQISDTKPTYESFTSVISDFKKLNSMIKNFCQEIKQTPPHLFNSLHLLEYVLTFGMRFIKVRDLVRSIDQQIEKCKIISIHLPTSPVEHRRFLSSSIKIMQVENRLISYRVPDSCKDRNMNEFSPSSILQHFLATLSLYRDNKLFAIWKQFTSTSAQLQVLYDRKHETQAVENLHQELYMLPKNPHIISLYEEFKRIFMNASVDSTSKSLHPLSHCILLLLKLGKECSNSIVANITTQVIDCIVSRLLIAKTRDDQQNMHYVIYLVTAPSCRKKENSYKALVSLRDTTKNIISTFRATNSLQTKALQILKNYSYYLDLLISSSINEQLSKDVLKYHINPKYIAKYLTLFFNSIVHDFKLTSISVPPIAFTSYSDNSGKISMNDIKRITQLLLTERWKDHDAQFFLMQYSKLSLFLVQVKSFIEMSDVTIDINLKPTDDDNGTLNQTFTELIQLEQKENSLFTEKERIEFAVVLMPLLLKLLYKNVEKRSKEEIMEKIVKTLFVPRCSDSISDCYSVIDYFEQLANKMHNLRTYVEKMKTTFFATYDDVFDQLVKLNGQKLLDEIKATDKSLFEEAEAKYHNFEKYCVLCRLFHHLTVRFQEFGQSLFPYIMYLSQINHSSLISQIISDGINLGIINRTYKKYSDDIISCIGNNKFSSIDIIDVGLMIKQYTEFDVMEPIKALIHYFDRWAVLIKEAINASIHDICTMKDLSLMRKYLLDCLDNPMPHKIEKAVAVVNKFPKNIQTFESKVIFSLSKGFLVRAKCVYNILLLKKYHNSLRFMNNNGANPAESQTTSYLQIIRSTLSESSLSVKGKEAQAKIKEMIEGDFTRNLSQFSNLTQAEFRELKITELKSIKRNLINKIRAFSWTSTKSRINLTAHFERCLALLKRQSETKSQEIQEIKDQIALLEARIEKVEQDQKGDMTTTPEIASVLRNLITDEFLDSVSECNINFSDPSNSLTDNKLLEQGNSHLNHASNNFNTTTLNRSNSQNLNTKNLNVQHSSNTNNFIGNNLSRNNSNCFVDSDGGYVSRSSSDESELKARHLQYKIRDAKILNSRLKRQIDKLQFPSYGKPMPPEVLTSAFGVAIESYKGGQWVLNSATENSTIRKELIEKQNERDRLFTQLVQASAQREKLTSRANYIEYAYRDLMESSNFGGGRVSKAIFWGFVEKSDVLFTFLDADIADLNRKLKVVLNKNKMTPAEYTEQFRKKF